MSVKGLVYYNKTEAGVLEKKDAEFIFQYLPTYLSRQGARPVSITLPLQTEAFRSKFLFPFFANLLSEGLNKQVNNRRHNHKTHLHIMLPIPDCCPGQLEPGHSSYCPRCKATLFGSRTAKVNHLLPFPPPNKDAAYGKLFQENQQHISISGVQEKYSLGLVKNKLELVDRNGHYILKPIPGNLLNREFIPANEHLTMQLAKQVFGIETAVNALIFFNDGSPAYLTKRFDYKPDGTKYQVEDFATLLGKTEEMEGPNFKYNASYEDIGHTIKKYIPAAAVALEKFFTLVVFNYLFSNGDAHLKIFSAIESPDGDYILAPAYDLMCTRLHKDDNDIGLQEGLYKGDLNSASFQKFGVYTYDNFIELGERIGIPSRRSAKIIEQILKKIPNVGPLVQRSFLSEELKIQYMEHLREKGKRFRKNI